MTKFNSLAQLLIVAVLGFLTAEGLLLQKQRPALLPDENMRNAYEAADFFGQELAQHILDESYRPGVSTPYPDEMHVSTTTETAVPFGEIEMVSETPKSEDAHLSVHPAKYIQGYLKRSSISDPDLHDIVPLALDTLSDSTGFEVTQRKEKGSSIPTSILRLFRTGGRTRRTCNSDDSNKPILKAGCGDHYLFPGYNVLLVRDEDVKDCLWRFRHTAPEVLVTLNGVESHHGVQMYIENAHVPTSLVNSSTKGERINHRSRPYAFRDLMFTLPTDAHAKGISVEVCVPASPENEEYAEYETHEWQCCDSVPNLACGLPMGSLNDPKFSIDTMPWEIVLSVTVKSTIKADSYIVTYCSGSLISAEWLLTTASCVLRPEIENPGSTPVVTVSFDDTKAPNAAKYAIKEFIVYPTATEDHDIALVRLAEKVRRRPVCLPGYSKPDLNADVIGKVGTVFGWVLDGEKKIKPYIATRQQKVISSEECSLRQGKKLPPHIFCTVDSARGNNCLADGDLLMGTQRFTLRGLSNPRLTCKNDFRTHTSVAHFMPWISNVTGIVMPF